MVSKIVRIRNFWYKYAPSVANPLNNSYDSWHEGGSAQHARFYRYKYRCGLTFPNRRNLEFLVYICSEWANLLSDLRKLLDSLSVSLFVCLSFCLSVSLSVCLSVRLYVCNALEL